WAGSLRGKRAHGGNAEAKNLDRAVPSDHDLRRFQAPMKNPFGVSVVESLAGLPCDILQVPNGESFFSGQHGGDAVALHVLQRGAELVLNLVSGIELGDIGAVQDLGGSGFLEDAFHQGGRLLSKSFQTQG